MKCSRGKGRAKALLLNITSPRRLEARFEKMLATEKDPDTWHTDDDHIASCVYRLLFEGRGEYKAVATSLGANCPSRKLSHLRLRPSSLG